MMSSSVPSTLKKRLVAETKMEAEEIDALWDQFTCLAGTEWLADPNNIGWALDRRAFNHAFIPRFNSFLAAPNLVYDRIFAYYDSDKNGLIGFEEWIKGIDGMHATEGQIKSKIVFDGYDIDGDGFISRKDVLRIFRAFYAIEKEATGNYVAEMTEELSVRNALDTISSGQPLGSAFTPHGLAANDGSNARLLDKNLDDFENTEPVLQEDKPDVADRSEMLRAANTRSVPEELPQDEQDRILTNRWARRQFYTDEEEGLDRPDCAEDDTTYEQNELTETSVLNEDPEEASDLSNTRPRWSRSSSRVRFQDDVDMETRSNASTSSRPFGERWGGYEIPEPEKDLGRDVLYQITQQGFNELLDPMFADRENDAMDAYATRSERRKLATQLEQLVDHLRTKEIHHLRVICKIGIFRWSKCIVDMFCNALNKASTFSTFENFPAIFQDDDGVSVTLEVAQMRLIRIYYGVQLSLLDSIDVFDDETIPDMILWNTWLCRNQLHNEVVAVALAFACRLGWISDMQPSKPSGVPSSHTVALRRDPTMPQFRPNSSADLLTADPSTTVNMSSCAIDRDISSFNSGDGQLKSHPGGPFFACTAFKLAIPDFSDQETVVQNNVGASNRSTAPVSSDNVNTMTVEPTTTSSQDHPSEEYTVVNWRNYTENPMLHVLHVDSTSGVEQLRFYMKRITHSSNPFHTEIDQRKPLYRHVRELAMDPNALSHDILLASLETVQQEIQERKGSGLINFDEFDAHMRDGQMRFLESWMEWVSI
jgi:Ca2+-binding EF-hand superfamily protein